MKTGYIDIITEDYFECKLTEDGELDYILTVQNSTIDVNLLDEIKIGRVVSYDMDSGVFEFVTLPPLTEEQINNAMKRADELMKTLKINE